jgi:hypothetical protein
MSDTTAQKVYARLDTAGNIIEYPVFEIHITNRAQPIDWYTPVVYAEQPTLDAFHYLVEVKTVAADKSVVNVAFETKAYTLDELLARIPPADDDPERLLFPDHVWETPSAEYVAHCMELSVDRAQAQLDAFAQTRNYDGMTAACTYATSKIAKFAAEAQYCVTLRDATWTALYAYQAAIKAGSEPLPNRWDKIQAKLPVPAWPADIPAETAAA